jgi:hypothetical protein
MKALSAEEVIEKMNRLLDDTFLEKLAEVARLYGWEGDYVEIQEFVRSLYFLQKKKIPDLTPYEMKDCLK